MSREDRLKALLDEVAKGLMTPDQALEKLNEREPLRVVTVRVPATIHSGAKLAAQKEDGSLNTFCLRAIRDRVQSVLFPDGMPKPSE